MVCMIVLKKITNILKNQRTYRVGLLQTRAYRILKQHTSKLLEPYKISSIEWTLLGLLYDSREGLRLKVLADELGVEAPLVTRMIDHLSKIELLTQLPDKEDSRAKYACLTEKGKEFVEEIEVYLRNEMKFLLKDIPINDISGYVYVLQRIIENSRIYTYVS